MRASLGVRSQQFPFQPDASRHSATKTFFVERSWSERWRTGESEGPEKIVPGREHEVGGYGPRALEEALAGRQFPPRGAPGPVARFAHRTTGEGQQIEDREHRRQMLFAATEIVLEVAALGFQDIECLVLDLPSGAAGGGEVGDIFPADLRIGDETVTISRFPGVVADLDRQPVDRHRLLVAARRHAGEPSVAAGGPFLSVPDAIDAFVENERPARNSSIAFCVSGLRTNRKCPPSSSTAWQIG